MTDRDTHFQGFAKLLWEQLQAYGLTNIADDRLPVSERDRVNREIEQTTQEVIAQRAYDLAVHVTYETSFGMDKWNTIDRVNDVPDLTEWPTLPSSVNSNHSADC